MSMNEGYSLVHITVDGEYRAPLVASQLFDQAEWQAMDRGEAAPDKVEAWILGAMREYTDAAAQAKLRSLVERCPHISVRMINGVGRLGYFPMVQLMKIYRRRLGKKPVIFHCRGESAAQWGLKMRDLFPGDKVVLDVRGFWPAEKLYEKGIEYPEKATGADSILYNSLLDHLTKTISRVDGVTTVSDALRALLIETAGATGECAVVPCCVSAIVAGNKRNELRKSWGVAEDEIVVVYSGTTAAYQHLEDLTIPFMKALMEADSKIRPAFFSSQIDKITVMLQNADVHMERVLLKKFKQDEVGGALSACDAGILIRKPTLVNRVANPVKIAEYLAAGLPIIIEKGVGGVADEMFGKGILKGVTLTASDANMVSLVTDTVSWLNGDLAGKRAVVQDYVRLVYLWSAAIHVSRELYQRVLKKHS